MEDPTHDYVAIAKCGCVVGLMTDMKGYEKETAKEVASFIREGCKVKHVERDTQEFRDYCDNFGHKCQPKQVELF